MPFGNRHRGRASSLSFATARHVVFLEYATLSELLCSHGAYLVWWRVLTPPGPQPLTDHVQVLQALVRMHGFSIERPGCDISSHQDLTKVSTATPILPPTTPQLKTSSSPL